MTKDPEQNLDTATIKRGMDAYNDAVREVAKEQGAILIDTANAVPKDLVHFIDDVHLTSKGNEDEAKAILDAILDAEGRLPHAK